MDTSWDLGLDCFHPAISVGEKPGVAIKGYLHLISNYRMEEKQLQEQDWRGGVHGIHHYKLELGVLYADFIT